MLIIGISGHALSAAERECLRDPCVAGVILFARNFASREQVSALCNEVRDAVSRPLLICVDQEGGPVQRFRAGFSALPALATFGKHYASDPQAALALAHEHAWLMASEIRACGLDLSFAPVVDLGRGNRAIGERAFAAEPEVVAAFTRAYVAGMHAAGMPATLKHFPGHGSVLEDTHVDAALDPRPLVQLRGEDLLPFAAGIAAGADAVMMAHVSYPAVDAQAAGYSSHWINTILRAQMGFRGVVFSDDIGMAAAESAGGVKARIGAHLDAGCDLVLVCAPALVEDALAAMAARPLSNTAAISALLGRGACGWDQLLATPRRSEAERALSAFESTLI
ncbi:MAG: beta-N-acetylhexosaminidase [Lysobacterales bacterium CG_4_10_14_3_um_filter_64_11]|nr:MAG: beta-N-acetylhexosaminidase [Xanthomonadales bacterium CG_4_10_14_3_um_filter_64_11]